MGSWVTMHWISEWLYRPRTTDRRENHLYIVYESWNTAFVAWSDNCITRPACIFISSPFTMNKMEMESFILFSDCGMIPHSTRRHTKPGSAPINSYYHQDTLYPSSSLSSTIAISSLFASCEPVCHCQWMNKTVKNRVNLRQVLEPILQQSKRQLCRSRSPC